MPLSTLAAEIYAVLRARVPAPNPERAKISYKALVQSLPPLGRPYADLHWRDTRLDEALGELVAACRAYAPPLPAISALVVNDEARAPGNRYYEVAHPAAQDRLAREVAWAKELNQACATPYPASL